MVFDDRTSFPAKRSIFINQILFRAKRWPFRRDASTPPAAFQKKRETVTEGEKERGREKEREEREREKRERGREKISKDMKM